MVMYLSFRGQVSILVSDELRLDATFDFLSDKKQFVIECMYVHRKLVSQKLEQIYLNMLLQGNGVWEIGHLVDGEFCVTDNKHFEEIKNRIVSEHCIGNYVGANRRTRFHYLMGNFRKIA